MCVFALPAILAHCCNRDQQDNEVAETVYVANGSNTGDSPPQAQDPYKGGDILLARAYYNRAWVQPQLGRQRRFGVHVDNIAQSTRHRAGHQLSTPGGKPSPTDTIDCLLLR